VKLSSTTPILRIFDEIKTVESTSTFLGCRGLSFTRDSEYKPTGLKRRCRGAHAQTSLRGRGGAQAEPGT